MGTFLSSAGIYRLPIELLLGIRSLVIAGLEHHSSSHYPQLRQLAAVCRLWASVSQTHSAFWTIIPYSCSTALYNRVIDGSMLRNLDVSYVFGTFHSASNLWDKLCIISHRWEFAAIVLSPRDNLHALAEVPDPNLRSVAVTLQHEKSSAPLDLFLGQALGLEHVWLKNITLRVGDRPCFPTRNRSPSKAFDSGRASTYCARHCLAPQN